MHENRYTGFYNNIHKNSWGRSSIGLALWHSADQ